MTQKRGWAIAGVIMALAVLALVHPSSACACGGLFSPEDLVDQNAERIIFIDNGDGTLSVIIQIEYVGSADDFAWVLPLPSAIGPDDIEIVEDGDQAFIELELETEPHYIPPPRPNCPMDEGLAGGSAPRGVDVYGSGVVGPFAYDVIGADDSQAIYDWLRERDYRVTAEMEPLIDVYVNQGMVFLAMQLQPGEDASSIQPVKITMPGSEPMIPLQMAAVAAVPDTRILVWFFGEEQAVPLNFEQVSVPDEEIKFPEYGSHNYRELLGQHVDSAGGQAFVTEYAGPSNAIDFKAPLLQDLAAEHRYLTRLSTVISPEEMTRDPMFAFEAGHPNVDNVHDLSSRKDVWDYRCSNAPGQLLLLGGGVLVLGVGGLCGLTALGVVIVLLLRRRKKTSQPPAAG